MLLGRRSLLVSTGAVAVSPGISRAAGSVSLSIRQQGTTVHVLLADSPAWMLSPSDFGSGTTLHARAPSGLPVASVSISLTLAGGAALAIDLPMREVGGTWFVSATTEGGLGGIQSKPVKLAAFLEGTVPLWLFVPKQATRNVVAGVLGPALAAPPGVVVELRRPRGGHGLTIELSGSAPFGLASDLAPTRLLVCPQPNNAAEGWRATALDPGFPRTLFLGRVNGIQAVAEIPRSAVLTVRSGDVPALVSGRIAVFLDKDKFRQGPILTTSMGLHRQGSTSSARFTLLDGHWRLKTRHAALNVSGTPMTGRIDRRGQTLTWFEMRAALHEVGIPVVGAEFSRLDYRGTEMALTLKDVPGAPAAAVAWPMDDPEADLPLANAALRVTRSADLMSLRFRFRNLSLRLGLGAPSIVRDKAADPRGDPDKTAVLVAEFPPQHVLEQAYLRQDVPLPDAGAPVTEQDLEILSGRDPVAAQARRQCLHKAKCDAAKADANGDDGFGRFAKAWASDNEKSWIGPAGLFDPAERARARALAWQLQTATLQAALDGVAQASPDIAATLRTFGLPDLGVERIVLQDIATRMPDPDVAADAMLDEAVRRSGDLAALQMEWTGWRTAAEPLRFRTASWPPELAPGSPDWPFKAVPALSKVGDARAAGFLKHVFQARLQERSEVGTPSISEFFDAPAASRLSGPSRLAFIVKAQQTAFDLHALTDWNGMELHVIRRAERFSTPGGKAMQVPDIFARLEIPQLGDAHARTQHIADHAAAPDPFTTALELPSRLLLSPAADVLWRLPNPAPTVFGKTAWPHPRSLWEAEMLERMPDRPTLRAVWSPDFRAQVFLRTCKTPLPGIPGEMPSLKFRSSMDALDRHELVGLSSLHGLPVIARQGADGTLDSSQATAGPLYRLGDIDPEPYGKLPQAVYVAKPFGADRLALSALGASLELTATFTPPAAARASGADLFDAFSLERWSARIVHGRETLVEVVRKGCTFPTGHRVSLVRTTQREIGYRHTAPPPGSSIRPGPYAPSIQRLAIETSVDPKLYPAPGQPNEGRDCVARSITILTRRTPDLLDPTNAARAVLPAGQARETPLGNLEAPVALAGLVFWPRTQFGRIGDVQFRMAIGARPEAVAMPMLFLDNRALHDRATVRAVVEYWNRTATDVAPPLDRFNVVHHAGTPRTYAVEKLDGDCTFVTDWQEVGAKGGPEPDPYVITPAMEGADQPPFYPILVQAAVRPQQIGALTGTPAAQVRVVHDAAYVERGFLETVASQDLGQRFLHVLDGLMLDMGSKGDQAGGVGRPAMAIAGFDREMGPDSRQRAQPGAAAGAADPAALLSGILSKFRVLGFNLINLIVADDIDKMIPSNLSRLTEKLEYDALTLAAGTVKAVADEVGKLEEQIEQSKAELAFQELTASLKELRQALEGLQKALKEQKPAAGPDKSPVLIEAVTVVWTAGRHVVANLHRLQSAPLAGLNDVLQQGVLGFEKAAADEAARLVPWAANKAGLQDLAESTLRQWVGAVVVLRPLPMLSAEDSAALKGAVTHAALDPRVWQASDPLSAMAQAVLADPVVARVARDTLTAAGARVLAGPLYDLLQPVIAAARAAVVPTLDAVAKVALDLQQGLATLTGLAAKAAAACADIADAVLRWIAAAVPTAAAAAPRLAAVRGGQAALAALTTDLDGLPGVDKRLTDWAAQLSAALQPKTDWLAAAAASLSTGRETAVQAWQIAGCADLKPASFDALMALQADRAAMVQACLAWAAALTAPPPGAVPVGGEAGLRTGRAASRLAAAAEACLLLALDATLGAPGRDAARTALLAAAQALQTRLGVTLPDPKALADAAKAATDLANQASALAAAGLDALPAQVAEAAAPVATDVEAAMLAWQADLLRTALRAGFAASQAADALLKAAASARTALDGALLGLLGALKTVRDNLLTQMKGQNELFTKVLGAPPESTVDRCGGTWPEYVLLVARLGQACTGDTDRLAWEASNPIDDGRLKAFQTRQSAPQLIVGQAKAVLRLGLRSTALQLLDVAALQDKLEGMLRQITPLRHTVSFSLDVPLPKKPKDLSPFTFTFDHEGGADPKLALKSDTTVGLSVVGASVSPFVNTTFSGKLPSLSIKIDDVLTLSFNPISYSGGSGQAGKLDATIKGVELGKSLKFLEALQSLISPTGSGPYVRIVLAQPAIEAGYVLAIGIVSIGTLSFSNINLSASMLMPFDERNALMAFSLGTLDQPFLISAAPYGGGGFFGIDADAKGIQAAHASFEYGAVAAIHYGPLAGIGRVTTGVYVRTGREGTELTGLFFAGFSGHVACFGVVSTFTLRLEFGDDGASGKAELVFSFSLGLRSIEIKATATRTMGSGFHDGDVKKTTLLDRYPGTIQLAGDLPAGSLPRTPPKALPQGHILVDAPDASANWARHHAYFDHSIRPSAP